jgi:hypothetical protein
MEEAKFAVFVAAWSRFFVTIAQRSGGESHEGLSRSGEPTMNVATGTLTINAAFLQEIKEDNRRVHELLAEVEQWLQSHALSESSPRRLVDVLGQLRDQVALHFSLEEAYGYFEDAIHAAPQLSEKAAELRAQHSDLFVRLCQMVNDAERWLYRETPRDVRSSLIRQFGKFSQDFRRHESREADLVLEAFESDVGVGD